MYHYLYTLHRGLGSFTYTRKAMCMDGLLEVVEGHIITPNGVRIAALPVEPSYTPKSKSSSCPLVPI